MNAAIAQQTGTKTRILDAAEVIFSQDGFDAASLRTITTAAQVNLAAVNYHFQTKEALFSAVIERRVRPVNERRIELLESIPGKPTVEKILNAFLRPLAEVKCGQPSVFRPLMARLHGVPRELHTRIIEENFGPLMEKFTDALAEVLPEIPREELRWRMFFLIGALAQTLAWGPIIDKFMEGGFHLDDFEQLIARLISFGAAGIKAAPAKSVTAKRASH
jgi:AcrR family transcriptional regulator